MNEIEVRRVHVNDCVRDAELDEMARAVAAAEPGDWRVRDGRVVRYGTGAPVASEASLRLMAEARSWVPRLVRGVRVLEEALRGAWISASSSKRELVAERELHEQAVERAAAGRTGPDSDIDALVEALELGAFTPRPGMIGDPAARLRGMLKLWATGGSVQAHPMHRVDLDYWRRDKAERDRVRAELDAEDARWRAEVRALLEELKLKKRERAEVERGARARLAEGGGDGPSRPA